MAKILVIEDNPTNLQLIVYLLQAFGHTPLEAEDAEGGLILAERERPDLILCDVQLPKMDGYEVARQLKDQAALKTIPLVAVTALAMVGDRDRVLSAGFDGYIPKPIEPETFSRQVEVFLRPDQRAAGYAPAGSAAPVASEVSPAAGAGATILMVDNSFHNVDIVRATLEPFGYRVLGVNAVQEALELARKTPPDLILCDVYLGGESGYDLLKAVKADDRLRSLPFVFISSTTWMEKDVAFALERGATMFIPRPIEAKNLLASVAECLKAHAGGVRNDGEK